MNQHQPLLHAISHALKRVEIPRQVESEKFFTADRTVRMDIVVRKGVLQDAPNWERRDKCILLDVTHSDPQAQTPARRKH